MFEFDAHFDEAGVSAAERAFFLRSIRRLRFSSTFIAPPLLAVLAAAGYILRLSNWFVVIFGVLFAFSLLFPLFMYFARPLAAAKDVRRYPVRHVRLTADGVSITVNDSGVTLPWTRFKLAWDLGAHVALVLSPFFAIILPKASLPVGAQQFIEQSIGKAA